MNDPAAHLVALKSSTYGALSLDSQTFMEDPRDSDPVNQMYYQMLNVDASGLPQSWSEVSSKLSRLKVEVQQNNSGVGWSAQTGKTEPQVIDISEFLEDVDEVEAVNPSSKSTASKPKGDNREIRTLEEVDELKVSFRDDGSSSESSSSDNDEVTSNFLSYYDSSRQPAFKTLEQSRRPDKRFSTSTVISRSRTSVTEKKSSKSISSTRSETSALFDPEFLASFQEEFEKLSATMPSSETRSQKTVSKVSNKLTMSDSEFSSGGTALSNISSTNNSGQRPVAVRSKDASQAVTASRSDSEFSSGRTSGIGMALSNASSTNSSSQRPIALKKKDANEAVSVPALQRKFGGAGAAEKFGTVKASVVSPYPGVQGRLLQVNDGPPPLKKPVADPFVHFEKRCPPDGEQKVVFFSTSLRGIRKTFDDCNAVRSILQTFNVEVDERDVSMDAAFRQQLKDTMQKQLPVPRLFIKGRYIGGVEEVLQLHEKGILAKLLEGVPSGNLARNCDGCGGVRFIPCTDCSGSCKALTEDGKVIRCSECNENGLVRCPICS